MFRFTPPSHDNIRQFLREQAALTLTYPDVGATAAMFPSGYTHDYTRIQLGTGEKVFHAATRALRTWRQFDLGWLRAVPVETPIAAGECVAILARTCGMWSLSAARIVYVDDRPRRFGFAYGTLPGHVEAGEERFLVEMDEADGSVWYDLRAFSRPRHPLAKLGYPLVRRLQKRFGRDSCAAMVRAVQGC